MAALWRALLEANSSRSTIKPHTVPEAALQVPILCNPGTKEGVTVKEGSFAGVWPANETFFKALRSKGGLTGVAVDPLTSHECGNQRYMAIRWLDACLTARLPEKEGAALRKMDSAKAWLAPLLGTQASPAAKYKGEPQSAIWLPDAATAELWQHYTHDTAVPDTTPPPAPTNLQVNGHVLKWDCTADLESGLAGFLIERDGTLLTPEPLTTKNPFGRPLFQGLQYSDTPALPLVQMTYTDTTAQAGKTHRYRVIAVNTVGLRSE